MRRIALALLVLPLALAACGSSGKSTSPQLKLTPVAYVKSAAKKTAQATSEHMAVNGSVTVRGQLVTLSGGGDFDNTNRQGSVHLDFSIAGLSGGIDEVIDGTTIYVQSPLLAGGLPKGKTWLKLDLQKVGQSQGLDFSALLSQNPTQSFAQLQASGDVTKVGEETIDGAATTHYRGHVDLSKLPRGAKIQSLTSAKYGPYDVWIGNDDGLIHRVKIAYSLALKGSGREVIAFTMDFSDFGKNVTVKLPADADSFDSTNAAIRGLGG